MDVSIMQIINHLVFFWFVLIHTVYCTNSWFINLGPLIAYKLICTGKNKWTYDIKKKSLYFLQHTHTLVNNILKQVYRTDKEWQMIPNVDMCTRYNIAWYDTVCQWLATVVASQYTSVPSTNEADNHNVCNWYIVNIGVNHTKMYITHYFSLSIFYLPTRHKLNKLMKSSSIYNKLQHYLIEHEYFLH
jgi:hypothetical protein